MMDWLFSPNIGEVSLIPLTYDQCTDYSRNRFYNVDVIGVLRGKYLTPAFALKIGESAIRNCLRDQLKFLREESRNYMGNHPVVFTEIGIPYDMDEKYAYKTGDYTSQVSAMDANHFALEGSTSNGYTLWVYSTQVTIPLSLFFSPLWVINHIDHR